MHKGGNSMRRKDKKEITSRTAVKAVITGYIAYGILLGFIFFVLALVVNWGLKSITNVNSRLLAITVPLIGVILLYFILRGICKLSIHDVFKKCKTNPNNLPKIISRLNLFVIIFIMLDVIASIGMLVINFNNQEKAIELATYQYSSIHSEEFVSSLKTEMVEEYNQNKSNTIISTVILELGMVVSWFSVIPLQKKLIEQCNKY